MVWTIGVGITDDDYDDGYDKEQCDAAPDQKEPKPVRDEEVYDSFNHVLHQLQTPEQRFQAVCEMLGVKTDGFTLDEMIAANPSLKEKGALGNAIHAADNFMADSANFVGDTYQEFKANNPQAAAVVEWVATKSMMLLYVGSLFTPAGLVVAGTVELAELTGLTDFAKENLVAGLKSVGFERSAEGMSVFIIGMIESKGGKKAGGLAASSKSLNALVNNARKELKTAIERVKANPMLMKQYVQQMEKITELKLHPAQTERLKEALRSTNFEKLNDVEKTLHRKEFNSITANLRREWEINTGQKWPVYEKNYPSADGTKFLRRAGQPYDAHHIIQSNHAGPNEWWNIHPAHGIDHHPKIHGKGAPAREIFTEPSIKGDK